MLEADRSLRIMLRSAQTSMVREELCLCLWTAFERKGVRAAGGRNKKRRVENEKTRTHRVNRTLRVIILLESTKALPKPPPEKRKQKEQTIEVLVRRTRRVR